MSRKRIVVAVTTGEDDRAAEALRAAVGLGLRGDAVTVVLAGPGERAREAGAAVAKAIATLEAIGSPVLATGALAGAVRDADAVEVWT